MVPFTRWSMSSVVDGVVDRFWRRPRGVIARRFWRDPKAHHEIFRTVLDALKPQPDDHLLEIGCGGGTFVKGALERGCRATAVDHSADMVAVTVANNRDAVSAGRLEVVQASADKLPLPNGRYTCATMMNVFFFLDAPATLSELHRVLAPGGRVVIHTAAPNPPTRVAPPPLARRMRFYTDDELVSLLEGAGFGKPEVTRVNEAFQLASASKA
jgi:ubiquinone/menaquinone biosynthesis C-methylase UbiE